MKKFFAFTFFLFTCCSMFAISFTGNNTVNDFDSVPMLNTHYGQGSETQSDYWDNVDISLITISAGKELYTWFGHSAILVEKPDRPALTYDWGRFSFSKDFYINFVMGNLWYKCGCSYASYLFENAEKEGRTVSKILLNLNAKQKSDIDSFLRLNASEQYNTYKYHYFKDNCSTRIRDIINIATEGKFETWAKTKQNLTYRQHITSVTKRNFIVEWLYDFVHNGKGDKEQSLWEAMFLPEHLAEAVRSFDSLMANEEYILNYKEQNNTAWLRTKADNPFVVGLAIGLLFAAISLLTYKKCTPLYKVYSCTVNMLFGLMGLLLLFIMTCTRHDVMYFNENLIFINPLLIVAGILSVKSDKHGKKLYRIFSLLCILTGMLLICKLLFRSAFCQNNSIQLCTLVPYYIANLLIFHKAK